MIVLLPVFFFKRAQARDRRYSVAGLPAIGFSAWRNCHCLLVFLFSLLLSISPQPLSANMSLQFRNLSLEQGLSQATINSILQDHKGFVWIGTQDGLNRYDGYQFKVYKNKTGDNNTISHNWITSLYEDNSGILWIGTLNGLNKRDPNTGNFSRIDLTEEPDKLGRHLRILSIKSDQNGDLWVGTLNGVYVINTLGQRIAVMKHEPDNIHSLSHNKANTILIDNNNNAWIGTNKGLTHYNPLTKRFTRYRYHPDNPKGLSSDYIQKVYQDRENTIWVGTDNSGLGRFNPANNSFSHFKHVKDRPDSLSSNRIRDIFEDSNGRLWIATYGGLNLFNRVEGSFRQFKSQTKLSHSLPSNNLTTLHESRDGVLWFGTDLGLAVLTKTTSIFTNYYHQPDNNQSIPPGSLRAVLLDSHNRLWVGTKEGLASIDRGTNQYHHFDSDEQQENSLSDIYIKFIFEDSMGNIWVGTFNKGVNLYEPRTKTFKRYLYPEDNSPSRTYTIHEDNLNNLWLGTNRGLFIYDRGKDQFIPFRESPQSPENTKEDRIYAIASTNNNHLWFGGRDGLLKLNTQTRQTTRLLHEPGNRASLSNNRVYAITQDSKGALWIATKKGVNRLNPDRETFVRYGEEEGLANNTTYSVLIDSNQHLWFSTNKGLSRFDPSKETFLNFTVDDGLQSNEFNVGAYYQSTNGELFFGGIRGLTSFYPEQITLDSISPQVALTDFLLFNKSVSHRTQPDILSSPIDTTNKIELNHQQGVFSIEFSAMQFEVPHRNQYAYKLDGYDKQWITTSANKRFATYTSLPSGHYTFRVKAANKDGLWSTEDTSLDIIYVPSPWQTWWAYSLYLLCVIAILATFVFQEYKKRRERLGHFIQLQRQKEQLQLALWGSGDELWDIDLQNKTIDKQNRMSLIEEPAQKWQTTGIVGGHIHPEDTPLVQQAVNSHLAGDTDFYEAIYRAQTIHNDWLWLIDRGQVVERDNTGNPLRFIGTTKDINQLKVTEAELKALNAELESRVEQRTIELKQTNDDLQKTQHQLIESEKMASLGNLVVGVSHQINTPLGISITALSSMEFQNNEFNMKMDKGGLTKKEFVNYRENNKQSLRLALQNLDKVSALVEKFKTIAVDPCEEDLLKIDVDQWLTRELEVLAILYHIDIKQISVNSASPSQLDTYPKALSLIFQQLIENSVTHGYDQPEEVKIDITVEKRTNELVIHYSDRGKGMDKTTMSHLFDPFYTSNRGHFIGLGMHVVYNQIAHLLSGSIECTSAPGAGCQYTIVLPLDLASASNA